jgi:hypothetical protein
MSTTFHDPTQQHCQTCGAAAPTWALTYRKNIGLIAAHWRWTTPMQVCKSCVHKEFWKRFAILVTIGWTSYYSIVIGPVFLIMNTVEYIKALSAKPTAEPAALPAGAAVALPMPPPARQLPPPV